MGRSLSGLSGSAAATGYRSLQQFLGWLDNEGQLDTSPMIKMRLPDRADSDRWPSESELVTRRIRV
jgi:hypothetical protein